MSFADKTPSIASGNFGKKLKTDPVKPAIVTTPEWNSFDDRGPQGSSPPRGTMGQKFGALVRRKPAKSAVA